MRSILYERNIIMTYKSPFTTEISISSPKDAYDTITHFCNYCTKDAISQYHCPACDAKFCEDTKMQIAEDFAT